MEYFNLKAGVLHLNPKTKRMFLPIFGGQEEKHVRLRESRSMTEKERERERLNNTRKTREKP